MRITGLFSPAVMRWPFSSPADITLLSKAAGTLASDVWLGGEGASEAPPHAASIAPVRAVLVTTHFFKVSLGTGILNSFSIKSN